jgi:YVTN family beta-propeller protein
MSQSIAIIPDGKKAYVTNGNDASVAEIDLESNVVVKTIVGNRLSGPRGIAIAPNLNLKGCRNKC